MLAKFPFGEATMGDVSANDGIAYFPIEIKSNYGIDLWNKRSTGSATVGSELLSTSPVITEIEDGTKKSKTSTAIVPACFLSMTWPQRDTA